MCDIKGPCQDCEIVYDILAEVRANLCTPDTYDIREWSKNFSSYAYLFVLDEKQRKRFNQKGTKFDI